MLFGFTSVNNNFNKNFLGFRQKKMLIKITKIVLNNHSKKDYFEMIV